MNRIYTHLRSVHDKLVVGDTLRCSSDSVTVVIVTSHTMVTVEDSDGQRRVLRRQLRGWL